MTHDNAVVKLLVPALLVGLLFPYCEGSLQNHVSLNRWTRDTCGANMFKCGTGECISRELVCDGEKNCKDRSDETKETCLNSVMPYIASLLNPSLISYITKCPTDEFPCDNGKCIHGTKRCDKKKDCFDGSDEKECENACRSDEFKCSSTCLAFHHVCDGVKDCEDGSDENAETCKNSPTPSAPPRVTTGCFLPPQPEHGEYTVGGCASTSCNFTPGTEIGNFAILNYTCHPGHELSGSQVVWCNAGLWTPSFPNCTKALCPPLTNPTRNFECQLQGSSVNCNEPMAPGTKAIVRCENYYITSPELSNYQITCSENGRWTRVVHSCIPECGLPNPNGRPFIANGREIKLAEFPWHVGIYQSFDDVPLQKCGGSLVAPRVVISAAHCFWNEAENKLFNTDTYKITAGKYYRDWQERTRYFQETEIEKVEIMRNFRGRGGLYAYDIAVVILKTDFVINEAVRPICLDLEKKFSEDFKPGMNGIIVGWGFTENNTQSEVLHAITLPYENRNVCIEKTKESFIQFLQVYDKFCVGTKIGKSVCPGDSGGGFATKFQNGGRYYLMGIVSAGVAPEGSDRCDIYQYSTFTKVSEYYSFIKEYTTL